MTNHPNRGWRGRWTVDAVKLEARHGPSGLVVRFQRVLDADAWDGQAVNVADVSEAMIVAHGYQAASRMLTRLMREAGDIFSEKIYE